MQWSFSNRGSPVPQLLSFHGGQEEKPKTGFDSLASAGLVTITTTEAFDSDHKSHAVELKNIVPEKEGGLCYSVTSYPAQNLDTHTLPRTDTSQSNLTISPAVTASVHLPVATFGQTLIGSVSCLSPQPLPKVPLTNPITAMPSSPVVGTTDLRNAPKSSGAPAQLTIFYNGSVCVYDNISLDKAQAIMLLAGNGPPVMSGATTPAAPVQTSKPRSSVLDAFVVSQPYGTRPHLSSLIPVTPISVSQPTGQSSANNDTVLAKPAGVLVSFSNIAEPLKAANSVGPVSASFLSSATVPQSRRKSLARFLEKRKERVISASPYAEMQSPDCSTPGLGSSVNSSGSCPVPAIN